nr:peptidylprolyl isomerase [Acidobacteriota bacterium]
MPTFANFSTTEGDFKVRLFDDKAPKTVANFMDLAEGTKEWTDPKTRNKVTRPFYD